MTTPFEHDLWEGQRDPALRCLMDDLDRACTSAALPPARRAAIARVLAEQAAGAEGRAHGGAALDRAPLALRWPMRGRRARALAGALLASALLTGTTVYAAWPILSALVDRALSVPGAGSGSGQIAAQHLGQQVDLVQSTCGYTMTVTRVYADANRVVIGYSVQVPPGRQCLLPKLTLTDATGRSLRPLEAVGAGPAALDSTNSQATTGRIIDANGHDAGTAVCRDPTVMGQYTAFDAGGAPGGPALPMHLSAVLQATEPYTPALPADVPCETYPPTAPNSAARLAVVRTPLAFTLQPAVDPRVRVVAPQQTVVVNGLALTLERVVITPVETRFYLRLPASMLQDAPYYSLDANGQSYGDPQSLPAHAAGNTWDNSLNPDGSWTEANPRIVSLNAALYDAHGAWTLTVRPSYPTGATPWVFHFASDPTPVPESTPAGTGTAQPSATVAAP